MRQIFSNPDKRLTLGVAVLAVSLVVLSVGLTVIVLSTRGDGAKLPSAGTIDELISESSTSDSVSVVEPPVGPPPPAPVRIAIPRLYIDAPVITMGLDENRSPQVPDRPDQVAWYGDFSLAPGQGGNAVMSGHVDWQTRTGMPIPGVFYRLRELELGDELALTLEDGAKVKYRVTGNVAALYDDPNIVKAMGATSDDVLTLITCGGTWVKSSREELGGNYSHRVLVRAERVIESVDASVGRE